MAGPPASEWVGGTGAGEGLWWPEGQSLLPPLIPPFHLNYPLSCVSLRWQKLEWGKENLVALEVPAVPAVPEKQPVTAPCPHILVCSNHTEPCDSNPPLDNRALKATRGRGSRSSVFHDDSKVTPEVLPQLHPQRWCWSGPISKDLASLLVCPCFTPSSSVPSFKRPSLIPQIWRGSLSRAALHSQGPAGPSLSEEGPVESLSLGTTPPFILSYPRPFFGRGKAA